MYVAALVSLAGGLTGCGDVVGYPSAHLPTHTQTYRSESAAPLPAGVDTMTGLQQRPMRPPTQARNAPCSVSSTADLGAVAPNYGAGVGPAYLSGQDAWYAAGQVAIIMVDSHYSGPLLLRAFQLGGETSTVTLDVGPFSTGDGASEKDRSHGITDVSAISTAGGGSFLAAVAPTAFWRALYGRLSTDGPGCFGFQVDGDVFTEFIVFEVNPGTPPPG